MAIEAIAIEDLVTTAEEVNADLDKLVISGGDAGSRAFQIHELKKLLPALTSGVINQSVILKWGEKVKDSDPDTKTISSATLNKWVKALQAGEDIGANAPTPKLEASNTAPVQRSSKHRVNISRAEYNDMEASITAYHKLLATMQGKKLVSEADALVIESIKTHQPDLYNSVLEGVQKETKARLEDEIRAKYQAMMDAELKEKLAAFQPVPVEAPVVIDPVKDDEPTFTPADETEAPVSGSKKK